MIGQAMDPAARICTYRGPSVEGFEHFVAVALEEEGLVVCSGVKFAVKRQTRRTTKEEQTHGYEVDLVGARSDKLVLATVKSFFGSLGVQSKEVTGAGGKTTGYMLLNDPVIRDGVVQAAADRYGYDVSQVHLRLYAGKWATTRTRDDRQITTEWCSQQIVGAGPIEVYGVDEVVSLVRKVAARKTYLNDPVIVAMKVLAEAGALKA